MGKPSRQKRARRPQTPEGKAFVTYMEAVEHTVWSAHKGNGRTMLYIVADGKAWVSDPEMDGIPEFFREQGIVRVFETNRGTMELMCLSGFIASCHELLTVDPEYVNHCKVASAIADAESLREFIFAP
jgi:hypothetical protein